MNSIRALLRSEPMEIEEYEAAAVACCIFAVILFAVYIGGVSCPLLAL